MKKNIFSDNNMKKSSKGFYAALGISAVMIGSACFFAYNQGEKLTDNKLSAESSISVPEAAVDKKFTDIPKTTTPAYRETAPAFTTTAAPVSTMPPATLPAADIIKDVPPAAADTAAAAESELKTGVAKLENVMSPLADASNVIIPFSGNDLVKNETTGSWQTHNGTDFSAEVGAEVYSISSGEITEISNDPLWGVTVVLNHHNGFITKYCGLGSDLSVQEGDTVASGDLIGVVGETADIESSIDPHLHLEVTHNGVYVDPVSAIKK